MRAGWRHYFKQRFKKPSRFFSVGIEIAANKVQISLLRDKQGRLKWLRQDSFGIDEWQQQFGRYVADNNMQNTPCHVSLGTSHYQLLQVDRPQVADEEINQALSWSVKDLVAIGGELVVDYFDQPGQNATSGKINVVAASKPLIAEICQTLEHAGLELRSIGVAEVTSCDLLGKRDDAVMTLFQQPGQEICLNIVKAGQLFFSRRLRGYENLSSFSEQELQMGVADNLSVEIQRSMDYFESQLKQAPVKQILLGLDSSHSDKLATLLQQLTYVPTAAYQLPIAQAEGLTPTCESYVSLAAALAELGERPLVSELSDQQASAA